MPLQTAFQKKYKSGGSADYDERYGHQYDEKAFSRLAHSMGDLRMLHRMNRKAQALRAIEVRAKQQEARAKRQAVVGGQKSDSPGMFQRTVSKLKGMLKKVGL